MFKLNTNTLIAYINFVLIFMLFNSKTLYKLTQSILGSLITTSFSNGCPTTSGLVLHGLLFALLLVPIVILLGVLEVGTGLLDIKNKDVNENKLN